MKSSSETRRHARLRRRPLGRYRYVRLRWRIFFATVDLLGGAFFAAARALRRCLPGCRDPERTREPRAILLVQLDHLGDALITAPMIPLLRRRWPQASIEVLASPANRQVFQAMPEVNRVYVCRANRFARERMVPLSWLFSLVGWGLFFRRRAIDLAIDVRGEFPLALLCWLTGARRRLGWRCGGGAFLLTDNPAYVAGRPEFASRLALLSSLGITKRDGSRCFVPFGRKETGPFVRPLMVLHVGAGAPAKMWPAEGWAALAAELARRHFGQVVLVGGRAERPVAEEIRAAVPEATDMTGRLELDELASWLRQADLFIGADSGPAHLAAAVGTPTVVLFSGTNDPEQWQPRGGAVVVLKKEVACSPCHRQRCPRPDHPCMRGLDLRLVLDAAEWMISLGARRQTPREGVAA